MEEESKLGQESAFPFGYNQTIETHCGSKEICIYSNGISKRFYAACTAMQGLCAVNDKGEFKDMDAFYERTAMHAYKIADEMLKQEKE